MNIEKETIVATLAKNKDEDVRVTVVVIAGRPYVGIAVFLKDGTFRHGVTLAPHIIGELIPVLIKALEEARSEDKTPA